ncbi:MAG: hypothetical protein ACOX7K_09980 [Oscillospiraceae bacterium]|jgi:hypothetical protein
MLDEILQMLAAHPMERLKWRICREFGVLPGSEMALQPTDYDYICCGANLLLDKRMHTRNSILENAEDCNPHFDSARFAALQNRSRT